MSIARSLFTLVICLLLSSCATPPAEIKVFRPEVFYLPNNAEGRATGAQIARMSHGSQQVVFTNSTPPSFIPPRAKFRHNPEYPEGLEAQGVSARVNVAFILDETGKVLFIEVSQSSDKRFNECAVEAIRKWMFAPARRVSDGVPVRVLLRQLIVFIPERDA